VPERSKKHHYVSQGILKQFCYKDEKKIWFFDSSKFKEGVVSRDISKKFLKFHYYSFAKVDGSFDDAPEREFFQHLDDLGAQLAAQLAKMDFSSGQIKLTSDQSKFVKLLIAVQHRRTPSQFSGACGDRDYRGDVLRYIADYEAEGNIVSGSDKAKLLDPKKLHEMSTFARISSYTTLSDNMWKALDKTSVFFMLADAKTQFVVSSNPVIHVRNRENGTLGEGLEVWMPITPRCAIGLSDHKYGQNNVLSAPKDFVRRWNIQLFNQSLLVGSASKRLLESLLKSR